MLAHPATGHHPCGTCKMGPSEDALAVVDQQGRGAWLKRLAGSGCGHHARLCAGQHQCHGDDAGGAGGRFYEIDFGMILVSLCQASEPCSKAATISNKACSPPL